MKRYLFSIKAAMGLFAALAVGASTPANAIQLQSRSAVATKGLGAKPTRRITFASPGASAALIRQENAQAAQNRISAADMAI
jgi:hypothetical protein